jgi:hypothetical protein
MKIDWEWIGVLIILGMASAFGIIGGIFLYLTRHGTWIVN